MSSLMFFYIMRIQKRQQCVVMCRWVLCCYGNCVFRTWVPLIAEHIAPSFSSSGLGIISWKMKRGALIMRCSLRLASEVLWAEWEEIGHTLLKSTEEHWRRTAAQDGSHWSSIFPWDKDVADVVFLQDAIEPSRDTWTLTESLHHTEFQQSSLRALLFLQITH